MDGNEQDTEARQARRENCGNDMNVIISGVLPFLDANTAGGDDEVDDPSDDDAGDY